MHPTGQKRKNETRQTIPLKVEAIIQKFLMKHHHTYASHVVCLKVHAQVLSSLLSLLHSADFLCYFFNKNNTLGLLMHPLQIY